MMAAAEVTLPLFNNGLAEAEDILLIEGSEFALQIWANILCI